MEETTNDIALGAKTVTQTARMAKKCGVPAFVLRYFYEANQTLFEVRQVEPSSKVVSRYTADEMADWIMAFYDAHNSQCSCSRLVPAPTWSEEVTANGGSRWMK